MLYLALGAAALWLVLWASGRPILKRREWRLMSASFALAAFAGTAACAIRSLWAPALVLLILGLWLAVSARRTGAAPAPRPAPRTGRMSADEARSILGVGPDASREEVQAAYTRLMRLAHPDKGGTSGLASQLNAARDRLLGR